MGAKAPPELMGIHSNMPGTVPAAIAKALSLNVLGAGTPPSGLSADEQRAYDRLNFLYKDMVPEEDVVATLAPVLAYFKSARQSGETLGDFCLRQRAETLAARAEECAAALAR